MAGGSRVGSTECPVSCIHSRADLENKGEKAMHITCEWGCDVGESTFRWRRG